jgi:hypothetical protein
MGANHFNERKSDSATIRDFVCHPTRSRKRVPSPAECFDQGLFFCFGVFIQGIEGGQVTAEGGRGEGREHFRRQPRAIGQAASKEDESRDAAENNLHSECDQHGHTRLPLPAHLAELEFAGESERRPVRDGQLAQDNENDGRHGGKKNGRRWQTDAEFQNSAGEKYF